MSPETRTLLNEVIESCLQRAKTATEMASDPSNYERDFQLNRAQLNIRAADEILEMMQREDETREIV